MKLINYFCLLVFLSFSSISFSEETANNEIEINQKLSQDDIEIEKKIIFSISENYFKNTLNETESNELFSIYVNLIMQGFNKAAETIWQFSESNENFNIDVNGYNSKGITPLISASISQLNGGNVEYLNLLLNRGANPNKTTKNNQISPLSLAATQDNYKTVYLLIKNKANFLKIDSFGMRALDYAKKHDSYKSELILLKAMQKARDIMIEKRQKK